MFLGKEEEIVMATVLIKKLKTATSIFSEFGKKNPGKCSVTRR
jgi:hypothetical protein